MFCVFPPHYLVPGSHYLPISYTVSSQCGANEQFLGLFHSCWTLISKILDPQNCFGVEFIKQTLSNWFEGGGGGVPYTNQNTTLITNSWNISSGVTSLICTSYLVNLRRKLR